MKKGESVLTLFIIHRTETKKRSYKTAFSYINIVSISKFIAASAAES